MKLISCSNCGRVRDADKVPWPSAYVEQNIISEINSRWNGEEHVPVVPCDCGDVIDETGASYC